MELSLEHIHPDLIDIEVEVDCDYYPGSNSRENDDPAELDINKVTFLEQVEYVDNGKKYTLYKGDELHLIDDKVEDQIQEEYARQNR